MAVDADICFHMLVYNVYLWISYVCWLFKALLFGDWNQLASSSWDLVGQLGFAPVGLIIGGVSGYGSVYVIPYGSGLLIGGFACRYAVLICYVGMVWSIDVFPALNFSSSPSLGHATSDVQYEDCRNLPGSEVQSGLYESGVSLCWG